MMKSKIILSLVPVVFLTAWTCDKGNENPTETKKWIDTDYGIYPYADGYCEFGILTNNYKSPIDSINGFIPCKGYIQLTESESNGMKKLVDHDFTMTGTTVRLENE